MKLFPAQKKLGLDLSHPARGAWIEINMTIIELTSSNVAPRKGCVD